MRGMVSGGFGEDRVCERVVRSIRGGRFWVSELFGARFFWSRVFGAGGGGGGGGVEFERCAVELSFSRCFGGSWLRVMA